ncbi:uncharacterized protein LOC127864813 isoform X2 [Dreissena polymorpha]|uniref:uncharacterized protein LOC127864813 isoform X2 n=1 Tax=Dreissena polymorpha TaxID=45954 RepID=UPI0022646D02|nr:uncharacterized protein LOC127864813 isoform X2 [Dreissena polymorpha]
MATSGQEPDREVSSDMIGECVVIKCCEPCTRKHTSSNATIFCKTCNEHLCEPCRNIHIIYKSGTHDTVAIEDLDSIPVVVTMKGMDKCRDHNKTIKFFCEDHSKLCCNTCAFIHRKCDNVNELASLSNLEGLELQDLNKTLLKLTIDNVSIKRNSEKALSETNENLPKQIDEIKDRIIDILNKEQIKIIKDADIFKAEEMKRLGEITKACSHMNSNINELIPFISAVGKHGTTQQKYIITKVIKDNIKDIETQITEERNKHVHSTVSVEFSKQLLSLLSEEKGFVKLKVERHFTHTVSSARNPTSPHNRNHRRSLKNLPARKPELAPEPPTEETIERRDTTSIMSLPVTTGCSSASAQAAPIKAVTLEQLLSVDIKQTEDDGKEPFLSGLKFLPDGRLVTVDNNNKKCILMDGRLQIQGKPYKFNKYPRDVECLSQCELAVTMSGKTVCLLSVSHDNVIVLTREIKTSTDVFSICCRTPTNMVFSTCDDSRPVRMITQAGIESDFDRVPFTKKTYKLGESKCTYVTSKNTLVLTDRYAHTVYMYDTVKGTSRAVTNANIQQPVGACVGPGDTVLVCSGARDYVVHLTDKGDILGTYRVDMTLPFSMCMNKDGTRLAVSNGTIGMRKLMMYKLS